MNANILDFFDLRRACGPPECVCTFYNFCNASGISLYPFITLANNKAKTNNNMKSIDFRMQDLFS